MRVRAVGRAERAKLQPWRQPWTQPFRRSLSADEIGEAIHLYRTGQASRVELAQRYGVSLRTFHRYVTDYPSAVVLDAAGARVLLEAHRAGLKVTPADAQRLAAAALMERAS